MKLQHSKRSKVTRTHHGLMMATCKKDILIPFYCVMTFYFLSVKRVSIFLACRWRVIVLELSTLHYHTTLLSVGRHIFQSYFVNRYNFSMIRWEIHITNIITNFEPNKKSLFVSKSRDTLSKNDGPLTHIEGWSDDYFVGVRVQYLFFKDLKAFDYFILSKSAHRQLCV